MRLVSLITKSRSCLLNTKSRHGRTGLRGYEISSSLAPPVISLRPIACGIVVAGVGAGVCYSLLAQDEISRTREESPRRRQFYRFASKEFAGEVFMTPQDFIESVIADYPRPRIKAKKLNAKYMEDNIYLTPVKSSSLSKFLFRYVGDRGIISFSEYVFLLSVITKPWRSFKIAFDLIDNNRNQKLSKSEFIEFISLASTSKEVVNHDGLDTTILIHLFGEEGVGTVSFIEFKAFVKNLQKELHHAEFMDHSMGTDFISAEDFARIILRYTSFTVETKEQYLNRLTVRLKKEERTMISFKEFECFCQILHNFRDFSAALQLYTQTGRSITKLQFSRAAIICLSQLRQDCHSVDSLALSSHLVDIVFMMFDKKGNNKLSHEEFLVVMRDWKYRGGRMKSGADDSVGFWRCVHTNIGL